MKRIGMGLVGAGFVGPHHVDAVRRLGFVDRPLSPVVGTFEDGYRANCIVEAILESSRTGGVWTKVSDR